MAENKGRIRMEMKWIIPKSLPLFIAGTMLSIPLFILFMLVGSMPIPEVSDIPWDLFYPLGVGMGLSLSYGITDVLFYLEFPTGENEKGTTIKFIASMLALTMLGILFFAHFPPFLL